MVGALYTGICMKMRDTYRKYNKNRSGYVTGREDDVVQCGYGLCAMCMTNRSLWEGDEFTQTEYACTVQMA
jgi:hypothetical protein